jgi:cardiolipin synthase
VNISTKWAPLGQGDGWRDDVLRVEGPAAAELERCFCASWRMQVQERLRQWRKRKERRALPWRGDSGLVVLSARRAIHRAYLKAIECARTSVFIAAGYFIPDRRMQQALKGAAARGVRVALLLAGKSDHPSVSFATRAYYQRLLDWGVEVYEWRAAVLHAKTAVVDGVWGTVGSFNLERMSLRFTHEANVVFADERLGGVMMRSFEADIRCCERVDAQQWAKRPFWQKALERFFFLFRKLI